jgi:hypothetical protein
MRLPIRTLTARVAKLLPPQKRGRVPFWDVISGAVPIPDDPDQFDRRLREALEAVAAMPDELPDRVEQRIAAALRLPCGLRELPGPSATEPPAAEWACEPARSLNRLGNESSSNGNGHK